MQTLQLVQGSPEWLEHRSKPNIKNASDAPSMMGVSPYESRDDLLARKATGITKMVDASTQKRFDDGHLFEDLSRPLAAEIIGSPLYPVTGVSGDYSASFDGLTMMEDEGFEHKTLNDDLRIIMIDDFTGADLPIYHRIQMEQQLMVCEGARILFMASKWEFDQETQAYKLVEERHCWYYPDLKLRQRIIDGWDLLERDLAVYVPPVAKEKVIAEAVETLPVPSVVVRGEITKSNIAVITPKFDLYLSNIKTKLSTDQDFADAEVNAKNCEETEKRIEALRANIIAQMVDVNAVDSELGKYQEAFRKMKVLLKNAVKEQKDTIKANAVLKAKQDFFARVQEHETEIKPIRLVVDTPNFADAIKGLKTIDSMHTRINQTLTNGYLNIEALARDIRAKLAWYNEYAKDHFALFADLQTIIYKPMDDFQLVVNTRLEAQKKRDEDIAAEAAKKAAEVQQVSGVNTQGSESESATAQQQVAKDVSSPTLSSTILKKAKPSAIEVVEIVAKHFMVSKDVAADWLAEIDFQHMRKVA